MGYAVEVCDATMLMRDMLFGTKKVGEQKEKWGGRLSRGFGICFWNLSPSIKTKSAKSVKTIALFMCEPKALF
jgi:hypothetical protein